MKPDLYIEVKNGTVTGVYSDWPLTVAVLDWDNITEPDGETSFCIVDGNGQPQIGVVVPVPVDPPSKMPAETRQVVGFFTTDEGQPRAR